MYTMSQKKLCQLIFCCMLVKYEPMEETLNKTMQKLPSSPKMHASTTVGNLK